MTGLTASPFTPVQPLDELHMGTPIAAEGGGQAKQVVLVADRPGWVYKEYRTPLQSADVQRLDRLIGHPSVMSSADRSVVSQNTSWPVARVVDDTGRTTGVCMPLAPSTFTHELQLPSGRRTTTLMVDLLALPDAHQVKRNIPVQTLAARVAVCASLAAVGALFERHGLVYLDWSFANAFWSTSRRIAFVIDIDGCSYGPRAQIQTQGWDDPLVPQGVMAGNGVDRYRVALLIARCLTGERGNGAFDKLGSVALNDPTLIPVQRLLQRALDAERVNDRPPLTELSEALKSVTSPTGRAPSCTPAGHNPAGEDGIDGWRPVGPHKRRTTTDTTSGPNSSPSMPTTPKVTTPPRSTPPEATPNPAVPHSSPMSSALLNAVPAAVSAVILLLTIAAFVAVIVFLF